VDKILIAGYGTFITDAAETLREDMTAKIYYWNVRVLGPSHLVGWKRILLPRDTHPYIIKAPNHRVRVLVVETDLKNLKLIDDAEGYPYHYDRITIETSYGDAIVYVPRSSVLDRLISEHSANEIEEDGWLEWIERSIQHNKIAVKYSSLFLDTRSR